MKLTRTELEGLGFCYNSDLPLEICADSVCGCSLKGADRETIETFRAEVAEDIGAINAARRGD